MQSAALRLAGRWRDERMREDVFRIARSDASPALVSAAIQALGDYQGDEALIVLRELAEQRATAGDAIEALMAVRPRQAAAAAMVALRDVELPEASVDAIVATFLRRQNGEALFVEALGKGSLPRMPPKSDCGLSPNPDASLLS